MTKTVLFALQSPTLLNKLAELPGWDLEYVECSPVDFQEAELLEIPEWTGQVPAAFFGCVPEHRAWADKYLPDVPYFHMIHSRASWDMGSPRPEDRVVGMQVSGLEACRWVHGTEDTTLLLPPYHPRLGAWTWSAGCAWSMMSRPARRAEEYRVRAELARERIPGWKVFGQDQPLGFLKGAAFERILPDCSCLVGMVGTSSGFGLIEHEAMSRGVPVVAREWGDLTHKDHAGLFRTDEEVMAAALRCCDDREYAKSLSLSGLMLMYEYKQNVDELRAVERILHKASMVRDELLSI